MHIATPAHSWVVMGVSGSGKTEIGRRLAARLQLDFIEGDAFHPPQNIARMSAGTPLTDEDRRAWLLALQQQLGQAAQAGKAVVLSCSALKRGYRDLLREADHGLLFVYLHGEHALLAARMHQRRGHFMPANMLDSQLAALEPLQRDERFIAVDIAETPEQIVDRIIAQCNALPDCSAQALRA
jgi:gluconokinase